MKIRNLSNTVREQPPGGKARPDGWYPRKKAVARADGRRHPILMMRKPVTVHQYACTYGKGQRK